jgi:hypothetical protein
MLVTLLSTGSVALDKETQASFVVPLILVLYLLRLRARLIGDPIGALGAMSISAFWCKVADANGG